MCEFHPDFILKQTQLWSKQLIKMFFPTELCAKYIIHYDYFDQLYPLISPYLMQFHCSSGMTSCKLSILAISEDRSCALYMYIYISLSVYFSGYRESSPGGKLSHRVTLTIHTSVTTGPATDNILEVILTHKRIHVDILFGI